MSCHREKKEITHSKLRFKANRVVAEIYSWFYHNVDSNGNNIFWERERKSRSCGNSLYSITDDKTVLRIKWSPRTIRYYRTLTLHRNDRATVRGKKRGEVEREKYDNRKLMARYRRRCGHCLPRQMLLDWKLPSSRRPGGGPNRSLPMFEHLSNRNDVIQIVSVYDADGIVCSSANKIDYIYDS